MRAAVKVAVSRETGGVSLDNFHDVVREGPLPGREDADHEGTRRYVVSGTVQGVGFRMWMVYEARRLGIRGWVRNLPDGTVEVVVAGSREQLAQARAVLERGPPYAAVREVRESTPATGELPAGFEVKR